MIEQHIDFILSLIVTSLYIWGIFAIFDEGSILWFVRHRLEKFFGEKYLKPLVSCPYCMSSFWGAIAGFAHFGFSTLVLPFVICLCGLNFIIKEYLYP